MSTMITLHDSQSLEIKLEEVRYNYDDQEEDDDGQDAVDDIQLQEDDDVVEGSLVESLRGDDQPAHPSTSSMRMETEDPLSTNEIDSPYKTSSKFGKTRGRELSLSKRVSMFSASKAGKGDAEDLNYLLLCFHCSFTCYDFNELAKHDLDIHKGNHGEALKEQPGNKQ